MPTDRDRIEVSRDRSGEWRWRRIAGNGRTVGDGAEGYTRRRTARMAAVNRNPGVPVELVD